MDVSNLARQSTPFVGRAEAIAEIARLLDDPACRLLTLVGPGGIGKTRLAIEVAQRYLPHAQPLSFFKGKFFIQPLTPDLSASATRGEGRKTVFEGVGMDDNDQKPTPEKPHPLRARGEIVAPKDFPQGVYFVPLQPLASADFIVTAIADVVGFQFYPGSHPKQQLLQYLHDRKLLLVLDNFEHLLDGARLVSEILNAAPGVRILATSRERLNLLEEWVFDVRELSYPADETATDVEGYESVQLFIQHAQRAYRDFSLTADQTSAVIRICRLVDGMPLGIELAAAWVRVLPCEAIAGEIERSLDILNTSVRNIEPRHRTMRAAFEPTWKRLSVAEGQIFKRLSIFRGGFTREAAESAAGASLRALSALVDKSLLRVGVNGRYDIHELLRQYALEQLSPDEYEQAHERHCAYYAEFLWERWEHLKGEGQKRALEEIEADIANVRGAWGWAALHQREDALGKMMDSLWFFYDTRAYNQEGWQAFRTAGEGLSTELSPLTPLPHGEGNKEWGASVTLGRVMARQGAFGFSLSQPEQARKLLEDSLDILRPHEARRDIGFALLKLSEVSMFHESNTAEGKIYLQESLSHFENVGDSWGAAYAVRWLGFAALLLEDFEEARRLSQEGLAISEKSGDEWGMGIGLSLVGLSALGLGDYQAARQAGEQSVTLCREIGLQWGMVMGLMSVAGATCALGEYEASKQAFAETLKLGYRLSFVGDVLWGLVESARLWGTLGMVERGVELLAFSIHHRIPPALGRQPAMRLLATLETQLPADVIKACVERGKMRDFDGIVAETIAELEALDISTLADRARHSRTQVDALSERELEILRLLAEGMTNQEIAEKLYLVVGTIKSHNNRIFGKLGVNNRAQAIRRGREMGLI